MTDPNPYSAPDSELVPPSSADEFELHDPRTVAAGQGWHWIADGFDYFKKDPGTWIGMMLIGFVLMMILNVIPLVNFFVAFTTYVWLGGIMLGCKAQYDNEPLKINHLFAGFGDSLFNLIGLGVITMLLMFAIMGIALGSVFLQIFMGGEPDITSMEDAAGILISILLACLFIVPVMMMAWFAPPLIVLNKTPLFKAMAMSFKACLVNIVPFLIYGIVLMVLMFIAMIPLGLGLLVIIPVMYASIFISYKDIFID